MDEWTTLPLEEGLERLIDYRGKSPPKSATGVPVISAKVVKNGRVVQPIEQTIEPSYYSIWMTRGLPEVGDVVMTTEGPLGEVARLDEETAQFALAQRVVCMRGKSSALDNSFLKYLLMSPRQQEILASYATGTTVAGISQKALRSIPITIPSLDEQIAIGELLSVLDDRIDLDRQMNDTLEGMVRAIFKDWFVDFGPTRAKAEGREPYLAPDIWDLFPDALDDDDKPDVWEHGCLADVADSPRRGISPADVSEETPYIGLEHMPRRSIALTEWEGAGKVTSNKSVFKKGEFLFGKLRPYFHKVGVVPLSGICSTDIVVLTPSTADWSAFVLTCISTDEFVAYTDQTSTGTKMPRTSWKTMGQYGLCLPPVPVVSAFQNSVQPMIDRIIANIHESRTLAQTRDLLLPKLMSGAIRLRNAEKAVEAVA